MMLLGQILLTQAILAACVLLGWFFGRRIHKFADKRFTEGDLAGGELGRLSDTLGFVSGAVGILLGLLLSFAVAEFNDTKTDIQSMGQGAVAVFSAVESFEDSSATQIRRDVVCVLRSASTADWNAIGNGTPGGSPATTSLIMGLTKDINNLELSTPQQQQAFTSLVAATADLTSAREALVMGSTAMIPIVVWIVIYFSSFVMTALLAMHLADRRTMAFISAAMSWGMLAVILLALTVLDSPLSHVVGEPTLKPTSLTSALTILEESVPDPGLWEDCPEAK